MGPSITLWIPPEVNAAGIRRPTITDPIANADLTDITVTEGTSNKEFEKTAVALIVLIFTQATTTAHFGPSDGSDLRRYTGAAARNSCCRLSHIRYVITSVGLAVHRSEPCTVLGAQLHSPERSSSNRLSVVSCQLVLTLSPTLSHLQTPDELVALVLHNIDYKDGLEPSHSIRSAIQALSQNHDDRERTQLADRCVMASHTVFELIHFQRFIGSNLRYSTVVLVRFQVQTRGSAELVSAPPCSKHYPRSPGDVRWVIGHKSVWLNLHTQNVKRLNLRLQYAHYL
ncbi:hypothetical protein CLF_100163 [Clonorchis sinensis]|uniref:Uncharacterized protein n=1 Tax=Clonorchis sinensis TaxID=79923 RepID=G7Y2T8_CLOSI|nr:hypothetical protein CLF_100163 [Clonorchis sinensis]